MLTIIKSPEAEWIREENIDDFIEETVQKLKNKQSVTCIVREQEIIDRLQTEVKANGIHHIKYKEHTPKRGIIETFFRFLMIVCVACAMFSIPLAVPVEMTLSQFMTIDGAWFGIYTALFVIGSCAVFLVVGAIYLFLSQHRQTREFAILKVAK